MPRGDMTGPAGQGPMTGRGMGYCAGYDRPGYMNPYPYGGRGYFGWGRGWFGGGRGWRNWQRAGMGLPAWGGYPSEKEMLSQELEGLKEGIKAIEKRLQELEGPKKVKKNK